MICIRETLSLQVKENPYGNDPAGANHPLGFMQ